MIQFENNIKQLCQSVIDGEPLLPLATELLELLELPDIANVQLKGGEIGRYDMQKVKAIVADNWSCYKCCLHESCTNDINRSIKCTDLIFEEC